MFINPFGGKKKGRKIYHSVVAPLFELAGISSHVIGERQQNTKLKGHFVVLEKKFNSEFKYLQY